MKHAIFGTLPGRAIVIGLLVKLLVMAAGFTGQTALLGLLDNLASMALVLAGAYLLAQGLAFANRRLLWRVRRKLIISYIFIGFVPAILIVAFFLLGGLLLFSNFSSYLVQNRLRAFADRAQSIAQTTVVDIHRLGRSEISGVLARRQADAAGEFPGMSFAVVRTDTPCRDEPRPASPPTDSRQNQVPAAMAGPWAHVDPPGFIPGWITCGGFHGLLASAADAAGGASVPARQGLSLAGLGSPVEVVVRAVSFSEPDGDAYAVVVDLPIGADLIERLKRETGVTLTEVRSIDAGIRPLEARGISTADPLAGAVPNLPLTSVAFLDYADWASGRRSALRAGIRMNVGETYDRIAAAEGEVGRYSFGQGLLLVLVVIGVLFLIIEALALVAGLALARSITGSVHQLFIGTERIRAGDFTHKIAIRAQDQLGELAQSFNSMTDSIENLLREQAEKKRLEEELRIAHEIQMSLLPQGPLDMPGLSVTALSVPAREVGGDYYDFLKLDAHRLGVLIADVSGKGTSAALYMAELKGLVLSLSRIHSSPRELLIDANRIIAEHLDSRSFITMTYAIFDLRARTVTFARAGHTPLIYLPAAGGAGRRLQVLTPDGMVVGLKLDRGEMFERHLHEETMSIHDGDLFLLFTDGVTEAMDASDDVFGEDRLGLLIEEHADLPSEHLRERLLREIAAFVGEVPQHDDMTFILLRIGAPVHGDAEGEPAAVAQVAGA